MRELHDVWRAICANPEDDEPRLEYATLIEPSDPKRAHFIRLQISKAMRRRGGDFGVRLDGDDRIILEHNWDRWTRDLAPFVQGRASYNSSTVSFDRGFPVGITVHPDLFVEQARLLFQLAPLRSVTFCADPDDSFHEDTFERRRSYRLPNADDLRLSLDRILGVPELARLDSILFETCALARGALEKLAQSDLPQRCVYLAFREQTYIQHDTFYRALATSSWGRNVVYCGSEGEERYSIYKLLPEWQPDDDEDLMGFSEEGQDLEREFGYLPWLHPDHNNSFIYDARWLVDHGQLPKFPFGTPPQAEWYDIPARRNYSYKNW